MTQRKVSASEFVADIRNGMSNADLQVKYHTSLENLERLFNKLVTAGHLKQSEIDSRAQPPPEFNCPACGATQENSFCECPKCGIIVAKFKGPKEIPPTEDEKPHNGPSKETFNNKEAENNRQDNESNSFEDFANTGSKLENCNVCGKQISKTAEICPNCGEKRFSNKTTVPVLGIVSVGLGVGASLMPYFAAVFLVPAAIVCGIITIKKGHKAFGIIAIVLGLAGLAGVIYTSNKITNFANSITGNYGGIHLPLSNKSTAPIEPVQQNSPGVPRKIEKLGQATTVGGKLACFSEQNYDDIVAFASRGDRASIKSYVTMKKCIVMNEGEDITILSYGGTSTRYAEFIYNGGKVWTIMDGIKPLSKKTTSNVVTLFDYDNIQKEMLYSEVCSIIGASGVELSRSDVSGFTTVMYAWKNSNGSNMNAMFQNGKLISKAQFGLP
jgi:rubrerythrin